MSVETQTVLLALSGSFLLAATNVSFTPLLRRMGSFSLVQLTNLMNMLLLGAIGLWRLEGAHLRWEAFAWFAVLGVLNFSINRWIFYTGLSVMGPSRHITITSLTPLLSLGLAVFALGEHPGPLVLAGTVLVVLGVAAVSYEPSEGGRWFRAGIGWSFTSTVFIALSVYMRNRGMHYMDAPALLGAWAALVALPSGEALRLVVPKRFFEWGDARHMVPLILFSTSLNGLAQIAMNQAMKGKLSLAVPISSSSPVFILLFSAIFLRGIERLNRRVVAGALITVAGMVIVGIGRHG